MKKFIDALCLSVPHLPELTPPPPLPPPIINDILGMNCLHARGRYSGASEHERHSRGRDFMREVSELFFTGDCVEEVGMERIQYC